MNRFKVIGNPTELILDAQSKGQAKRIFTKLFPNIPILGIEVINWNFSNPEIEKTVSELIIKDIEEAKRKQKIQEVLDKSIKDNADVWQKLANM